MRWLIRDCRASAHKAQASPLPSAVAPENEGQRRNEGNRVTCAVLGKSRGREHLTSQVRPGASDRAREAEGKEAEVS